MEFYAKSKVYIQTDTDGRILRCEGQYTLPSDLDGWTLIEEGAPCDRLNLAQSHYLTPPLRTSDGLCAWKYEGGALKQRTEEELDAERAARPASTPSQLDRIEAQTTYTAMMTDTLLEG